MTRLTARLLAPPAWIRPARRDLWLIALIALLAILAVQSHAWPRSLVFYRERNAPPDGEYVSCSNNAPSFGLPDFRFGPSGTYYMRHWRGALTANRGGVRLEWHSCAEHAEYTNEEGHPGPGRLSVGHHDPWEPTADSRTVGGGCIIDFERIGWGGFAGEFHRYHATHRKTVVTKAGSCYLQIPADRCGAADYWVAAPIWPLAVLPLLLLALRTRTRRRYWQRTTRGLCLGCGYDLRASADYCPECGRRR